MISISTLCTYICIVDTKYGIVLNLKKKTIYYEYILKL
nr:MAG TPA: hypothetical protein [Caudoviricetes sp.]